MRVEVLARDLGVSKGSFYWHFRDRRELLERTLTRWEQGELALLDFDADATSAATRWARIVQVSADPSRIQLEASVRSWARRNEPLARQVVARGTEEDDRHRERSARCRLHAAGGASIIEVALLVCLGWLDRATRDRQFQTASRALVSSFPSWSSRLRAVFLRPRDWVDGCGNKFRNFFISRKNVTVIRCQDGVAYFYSGNPSRTNVFQGSAGVIRGGECLRGASLPEIIKIEDEKSFPMQKRAPALGFFACVIGCALILAACGGGSGGARPVTSVAITPTTASVPINGTTEVTASGHLASSNSSTSTSTVVTWEVNGVAGGSTATGTIVPSTTDEQVGVYTAPGVVPSTNNGQVNITAVAPQNPGSTTSSTSSSTITSNTAVVTIGAGTGLVDHGADDAAGSGRNFTPLYRNTERFERPERDVVGQCCERRRRGNN